MKYNVFYNLSIYKLCLGNVISRQGFKTLTDPFVQRKTYLSNTMV